MKARIDRNKYPHALKAMRALHEYLAHSTLDPVLNELISLRASQINGCAWCLDMHSKELRASGMDEQKLHHLAAWRESPLYTDRERAALSWTEAVTRLEHQQVPDAVYEEVRQQFGEEELVDLTLAVASINGWNRLNIALRTVPGGYRPRMGATVRPGTQGMASKA
ncbi:MAG TPA: carboxymuconolactone decarboxylase family protein [Burkholderiales bacterium]|nr:carboxymuconolactone decarboxylase family protein [Burkholderiales bacterium]